MVIGTLTMVLHLHAAASLKDKRSVVKRIIGRTREAFNIAASEVADHDVLRRAVLGFVAVGNDTRVMNSVMDKVLDYVDNLQMAQVGETTIDVFTTEEG